MTYFPKNNSKTSIGQMSQRIETDNKEGIHDPSKFKVKQSGESQTLSLHFKLRFCFCKECLATSLYLSPAVSEGSTMGKAQECVLSTPAYAGKLPTDTC